MTKEQKSEIKRIIKQGAEIAITEAERLSRSGGIALDSPWFCLALAHLGLKEAAATFAPISSEGRKEVKNLENF